MQCDACSIPSSVWCLLLSNALPLHESEFGISTKGNSRLLRKDFCKPAMELHFPTHVTRSSAPHLSSVCLPASSRLCAAARVLAGNSSLRTVAHNADPCIRLRPTPGMNPNATTIPTSIYHFYWHGRLQCVCGPFRLLLSIIVVQLIKCIPNT